MKRCPTSLLEITCLVVVLTPVSAVAQPAGENAGGEEDAGPMSAATFAGLKLRSIGPALMSGRIADIAIHPEFPSLWYAAVGSGSVWKTTNAGTTWTPIFDDQASYSIGCITLDPSNPNTIWVGTGENVGGRHVGFGDGVYRSRDGGASWENMGLRKSEHIGNIVVSPKNSDVVYVAAQGPLWSPGGERGLYKTTDGGASWDMILGGGQYTGVNEVRMDPRDPNVLYATTHQRVRNVAALIDGGPESGIHKSTDGGETWRKLSKGLPEEEMGRIGLAISPQQPDVIYATIELAHRKGGFYRSEDGGESWEKQNDYLSGGTGPHYYQELFASPHQFDRVYQMDVWMHVTEDGGETMEPVGEKHKHVDNHALAFRDDDPYYLLAGCDGGLYESWDLGEHWKFVANLPVTQFYKVAVDYDEPFYNIVGGTQDNSTQHGPARTDNTHGIRNSDWTIVVGGDGHQPAIDPTNPDIIYGEWQQGSLVRHDRKTGEIVFIQPQPAEGEPVERFNWDSPIVISPHDPARLYFAGQRVWRSDDRGDSWTAISGDLSRGIDRFSQPMMGRVWSYDAVWDTYAMSMYGNVTSLSESPLVEGLLYAGTDDGLIQVSENDGQSWRKLDRLPGVPEFFFVNDIKADLHNPDTVYVCVDNHKAGDFKPYVLRSTDRGRTWNSIAGDLPERHIVWRLVQDHVNPDLLFLGTEFGVFFTVDSGKQWIELKGGTPTIPFRDLAIQRRENDLVGATFGRGFYVLDDYTALRHVSEQSLQQEADLYPVRDAWWYIPRRPLGGRGGAWQGAGFFVAPNPPFGATFTYYLRDTIKKQADARRDAEKETAKQGGDTPTPGWDALREEARELDPAIVLTVRDATGEVVRRLTGPAEKGMHRVAWSLTYPSTTPWSPSAGEDDEDAEPNSFDHDAGALVAPGAYTVQLAKRLNGELIGLGKSQSFNVVPLRNGGTLPGASPTDFVAFRRELAELQRSVGGAGRVLEETATRLRAIRETLDRSTADYSAFADELRTLDLRVADLQEQLSGDPRREVANEPGPISIRARLWFADAGSGSSLYGPTENHRAVYEIARRRFAEFKQSLNQIVETNLPDLEHRLNASGLPWTPGRIVPRD